MNRDAILIIEDDPSLLRGLRDNFRSRGFDVTTADDGQQGLAAATLNRPDLILLDVMLPKLNGFELCHRLRKSGMQMPIIMLTAKGQEDDIVRGLELGADDYVTKPFAIRELVARVRAFLRRREGSVHLFQFGPYELDVDAHKLFRAGEEVTLTTKEFRLLEYFLKRPGRALTRREILDVVWGHSVIVTLRSVDRCVTTLRGKIELNAKRPTLIRTVRDVGYRFELPAGDG